MKKKIIIGVRGSKLALAYARRAKNLLIKNQEVKDIEIKTILTTGDMIKHTRVSEHGGKGLFCKKIEKELLDKNIDIAVHSLKDMPIKETEGLLTNCFLERNDPRDVLISDVDKNIKDLKTNAIVGTSSFRREFQIKKIRNDISCKLIRGNVDTRIEKLNKNLYNAIILSYAGIKSLGLEKKISQIFSTSEIIPSAGQGVVALQCREKDKATIDILKKINHNPTHECIKAERAVLSVIEGDCETAVGAFANITGSKINLEVELFSLDGKKRFHIKSSKDLSLAKELGIEVGKIIKKQSKNSYKK